MFPTKSTTAQSPKMAITTAISSAEPTPYDFINTEKLKDVLKSFDIFESHDNLNKRHVVLDKLNNLVQQWTNDISVKLNKPDEISEKSSKIFTFGSFRLGVLNKDSDIDVLCVVARHISREDFFSSFLTLLKKQTDITDIQAIPEAYVPILTMKIDDIEVDLLFARLNLVLIPPKLNLLDDNLLEYLDKKCVLSMNGCRNTEEIVKLVPNIENFQLALRAIKLWAKQRGIYGNALGFPGGVSWAILVARVCQLYPNAVAAVLVEKFFLVYSNWEWPKPILLRAPHNKHFGFPVWDPRVNLNDRQHLMPTITLSYPHQNSTFNVSKSSLNIIVQEIKIGFKTIHEIITKKQCWPKLFERSSFINKYKHFVVASYSAKTKHDLQKWSGLIENKIRLLVNILEQNPAISVAHINTRTFQEPGTLSKSMLIGLQFIASQHIHLDVSTEIAKFISNIKYMANKQNMYREEMLLQIWHSRRKQLFHFVSADVLKETKDTKPKIISDSKKRKREIDDLSLNAKVVKIEKENGSPNI